jgi:hypothetical protein
MAPTRTEEQLIQAMDEIGALRERLDIVLEHRDRAMQEMHDSGYSFEAIAKLAGDISHVGVFRALKRRAAKDDLLREMEATA